MATDTAGNVAPGVNKKSIGRSEGEAPSKTKALIPENPKVNLQGNPPGSYTDNTVFKNTSAAIYNIAEYNITTELIAATKFG